MTAPKTMAASHRFMSTEVVRNIDQIKDITVTPNNSAGLDQQLDNLQFQ